MRADATGFNQAYRTNSLLFEQFSLLESDAFPVIFLGRIGELARHCCTKYDPSAGCRGCFVISPVFFPVIGQLGLETASLQTASTSRLRCAAAMPAAAKRASAEPG